MAQMEGICAPDEHVSFGKHNGDTYRQVFENDLQYCRWCTTCDDPSEGMQQLIDFYTHWRAHS